MNPSVWRVGGRVGPYLLQRELGRGGMGVVFLALDERTARPVALKTIHNAAPPAALERFEREARAQARVDRHPNVATIHDLGVHEGVRYVVQDYAGGGDLKGRIHEAGKLSFADAQRIVAEVAGAVAHLHAQGVIHRDLKPANVLFHEDGRAVLGDFGIAKLTDEAMTQTGETMGSLGYMAPEQVDHAKRVDARADVYGLGAILYACVCGEPPFVAEGVSAVHALLSQPPPRLGSLRRGVPPGWEELVARSLAKDPVQRHPSASAFRDDLLALSLERPVSRQTLLAIPLGGMLVVMAGALVALLITPRGGAVAPSSTPSASREATPTPSQSPARWVLGASPARYALSWSETDLARVRYEVLGTLDLRPSEGVLEVRWRLTSLQLFDDLKTERGTVESGFQGVTVTPPFLEAGALSGEALFVLRLASPKDERLTERRQERVASALEEVFRSLGGEDMKEVGGHMRYLRDLARRFHRDEAIAGALAAAFERGPGCYLDAEGARERSVIEHTPLEGFFPERTLEPLRAKNLGRGSREFRLAEVDCETRAAGSSGPLREGWPAHVLLEQRVEERKGDLWTAVRVELRLEP